MGKVVLNGSENNWAYVSDSNLPFRYSIQTNIIQTTSTTELPKLLSNYYTIYSWSVALTKDYSMTLGNNTNTLCIRNKDISTLENFKTWLSTHNTEVYYVLETPEPIDLQTTVDLKLFKGVNNVSNSEDGYMTIEYR
jgi:hypothetical protein